MNKADSIKSRLKNLINPPFSQKLLDAYCRERVLYRLSISKYAENFYLKGGSFIYLLEGNLSRPTQDIDLLGKEINHDETEILRIFKEICAIEYEEDAISFQDIHTEKIIKEGNYPGIRVKITAVLNKSKIHCPIDIGFGDILVSAQKLSYPTFLPNLAEPILHTYSIESLIAEKFQAMIDLGEMNSRMKDFYDICTFLDKCSPILLEEAIIATLTNRETPKNSQHPIFSIEFYTNIARCELWDNFLKRNNLRLIDLKEAYPHIKQLEPIYFKYCNVTPPLSE